MNHVIHIKFQEVIGQIKPVHGVNNGPLSGSETKDLSRYFRLGGIPLIRFHDTDYPNPRQVDIPKIFPDFSKDPADAGSYDFRHTDVHMAAAYETGAKVLYRLGTSIEHMKHKVDIYPPKDYGKWAQICIGIIRHYTQGWADGFTFDVPYWEIWNEPDNNLTKPDMWIGEPDTYYRLYETAAKVIKAAFPSIKVGGYAGCTIHNEAFREGFLRHVRNTGAPLDFFSWHGYSSTVDQIARDAVTARERLRAYGLEAAEILCDEWNYIEPVPEFWTKYRQEGSEYLQQELFEKQKSRFGASFLASCFVEMQNSPLAACNYYDAQPSSSWCGMFNLYGVPQPAFYSFVAFNALYRLGRHVAVQPEAQTPQCLAARDEKNMAILLSHHGEGEIEGCLDLELDAGFPMAAEFYLLQDLGGLQQIKTEVYCTDQIQQYYTMDSNSVLLIKLHPMKEREVS